MGTSERGLKGLAQAFGPPPDGKSLKGTELEGQPVSQDSQCLEQRVQPLCGRGWNKGRAFLKVLPSRWYLVGWEPVDSCASEATEKGAGRMGTGWLEQFVKGLVC